MVAHNVSVRELHARTGHWVRKAAGNHRIVVTERGKPIAEIVPLSPEKEDEVPYFARRVMSPAFRKLRESGALRPKPGDRDITELISEERSAPLA